MSSWRWAEYDWAQQAPDRVGWDASGGGGDDWQRGGWGAGGWEAGGWDAGDWDAGGWRQPGHRAQKGHKGGKSDKGGKGGNGKEGGDGDKGGKKGGDGKGDKGGKTGKGDEGAKSGKGGSPPAGCAGWQQGHKGANAGKDDRGGKTGKGGTNSKSGKDRRPWSRYKGTNFSRDELRTYARQMTAEPAPYTGSVREKKLGGSPNRTPYGAKKKMLREFKLVLETEYAEWALAASVRAGETALFPVIDAHYVAKGTISLNTGRF